LWQYFARLRRNWSKPFAPMAAPKGMDPGTVVHFSCKPVVFGGAAVGATMTMMDPW
jgi:hypothetical protein